MKTITLQTKNANAAQKLASEIISNTRDEMYRTWSYEVITLVEDSKKYPAIFHNPPQFIENLEKHIWFIPATIDSKVIFRPVISEGYELTEEQVALQTGRLLEILMTYHYEDFTELTVK